MLLLRALICAFRVADVKEFMMLSMQILNLRTFPTFASIAEQIMANIGLIRQCFPPHIPITHANMSSIEVCYFSYFIKLLIYQIYSNE